MTESSKPRFTKDEALEILSEIIMIRISCEELEKLANESLEYYSRFTVIDGGKK